MVAVLAVTVSALVLPGGLASGSRTRQGGTFRISTASSSLQSIDPAILGGAGGFGSYLTAVCEMPLGVAPGTGPAGVRIVPQAAVGYPTVSPDRKTYTFTIRKGLRFASGAPLTARSYVAAINRALNPRMHPDDADAIATGAWGPWNEIAGASAVLRGRATTVSGVRARGRNLVFTLEHADGVFPVAVAGYPEILCPVEPNLPVDPEGIGAPFSGGGPYYIASWVPGQRVVFERNRFYGGIRTHRVDRFVIRLAGAPDSTLHAIDAGDLDWTDALPATNAELARRYGVNKSQFFVQPTPSVHYLALNTARPLFSGNARLRRAVNFAIDRGAILRAYGPYEGSATDQYVSSMVPGFRDAHIYPLSRPDLRRARALARGRTRSGKAVFYARDDPRNQAIAQIVKADLAKIGLDVEIKTYPSPVTLDKIGTLGEPFDIAFFGWTCDPDPECFLGRLDGRTITASHNIDFAYFDSPRYNRQLAQASALPLGPRRYRAFAALDAEVAGKEAPLVALVQRDHGLLFSKRASCIRAGFLDLSAFCLK
jgi:peptide/nickel transport system substrate-binding protein